MLTDNRIIILFLASAAVVFLFACQAMLSSLGLDQYEKNFVKAGLTDDTLRLITDSALMEAKIPPGPRLLILDKCKKS